MKYYRCRCGESEAWGSMSPFPCLGCSKCETTLEVSATLHRKPILHNWIDSKVETNDGQKRLNVCAWCGITLRDWESEQDATSPNFFILEGARYAHYGDLRAIHVRSRLQPGRSDYSLHIVDGKNIGESLMDLDEIPNGSELIALPEAHV